MPRQYDRTPTRIHVSAAGPSTAAHLAAERHLVERAGRGDLRAWELVVRRHQETTYRLAVLMLGDADLATEATRLAFVRAYRALPGLPPVVAFRPWLIGVVATTARAQRRELATLSDRNTRAVERSPAPRLAATPLPAWVDARAMPRDLQDSMASTFERLAWDDRLTIAARYLLGLSREEAATLLSIEPGAVDESLRAAVQRLRVRSEDPRLHGLPADRIGPLAIAIALGETRSTPDVAPSVTDRLVRDAIAYPEHFARTAGGEPNGVVPAPFPGGTALAGPAPVKRSRGRIRWIGTTITGLAAIAVVGAGTLAILPVAIERADVGSSSSASGGPRSAPTVATAPTTETGTGSVDAAALAIRPAITTGEVVGRRAARVPLTLESAGVRIERRTAGGGWATVGPSTEPGHTVVRVPTGRDQAFRVAPPDGEDATAGVETRLTVKLRDSERVRAIDGRRRRQRDAIGGSVLSLAPGSSARATFDGQGFALVSPVNGAAGTLSVTIDGRPVVTQELAADERAPRRVVLSEALEPGRHSVVIGAIDGRVDLDAILILS
jgi:RNA polymerase sigma-70 factor (ECF subfamily)